jgi:hypothetical protein
MFMLDRDILERRVGELLGAIPEHCTLPEWQSAYRQVIFAVGMEILRRFPMSATRWRQENRSASGGQGAGGHPGYYAPCGGFLEFPAFVLNLEPDD